MVGLSDVYIFVGHFGSGKTETAINFCLKQSKLGIDTTLIDLDIINPFYRSSEVKDVLDENNISLIAPNFIGKTLDVPSLSSNISSAFVKNTGCSVFDVGGDKEGATVLSRYKKDIEGTNYKIYFVINTRRILTQTKDEILCFINEIENSSRLKITNLIANTNLGNETTISMIEEGYKIVKEVSKESNIPIAFVNVSNDLIDSNDLNNLNLSFDDIDVFNLDLFMNKWHYQNRKE